MLAIDHIIFAVTDYDRAGDDLLDRHGVASLLGGRHPGHGTLNRIVPLGSTYLELMAVIDEVEAATSPMGRWVIEQRTNSLVPAALCLRTDDIGSVADRLGLIPLAMTRTRTDGVTLAWHLVGLEGMLGPERLPFFIEWNVKPPDHPGAAAAPHRVFPTAITEVVIGPVTAEISSLLVSVPGLVITEGHPGVHSVTIGSSAGDIILG